MENRPHTLTAAREAVAFLVTLGLVIAGIVFLSMANAAPGERSVELQQPAPPVAPVTVGGGRAGHTRARPLQRQARIRFDRLRPLARVANPKMLGFQWPVVGMHEITSPFGPRHGEFHHGADIGCGIGQRLYSSRAGRVIGAGDAGPGYGLTVWIDHGSGYQTLYGHLSKLEVRAGQAVRTRQEIGLCGESGNATGPHVHFEMRYGGFVWDPLRFLP
jgi:septal ring factor EnvC (AmiA/AmiB activator)